MYYIQNGYVGNAILWWAENSRGYTTDFTKAGKYTKEGDIIFDPFMGSGTTAEACAKEKRGFIGCEMNKQYFEIASKRIKLYQSAPSLF